MTAFIRIGRVLALLCMMYMGSLTCVQAQTATAQARLTPFQTEEKKFGYIDAQQNVSIDPRFDEALPFAGNFAFVRQGNLWGMINAKGKLVIPAQYEDLGWSDTKSLSPDSTDGVVGYKKDGKWGLMNVKHKPVTPPTFDQLHYFGSGRIKSGHLVDSRTQETHYGLLDLKGNEIIPPHYNHLSQIPGSTSLLVGKMHVPVAASLCPQAPCNILAYGLLDENGKELLTPKFKQIKIKENRSFEVIPFNEWKVIAKNGREHLLFADHLYPVLPAHFAFSVDDQLGYVSTANVQLQINANLQSIAPAQAGFAVFMSGGKAGVKVTDEKDRLIDFLPARYDSLFIEPNGIIRAGIRTTRSLEWELITRAENNAPQKITAQPYQWIDAIKPHVLTKVRRENRFGYIDSVGQEVVPAQYDFIGDFKDSLCLAQVEGKYGILKKDNTWYWEPKVDFYDINQCGYVIRQLAGITDIIDLQGKKKYTSKVPLKFLPDGSIEIRQQNKVGRISPSGELCVPAVYDSILPMTSEHTFWAYQGTTIHLYHTSGEMLLKKSPPIERIWYEYEKYAPVMVEGKFGYVDGLGRLRIANRYQDALPFSEGLAAIKVTGKWGFINAYEKIAVQPYYDAVTPFQNGYAFAKRGTKWGLINRQGKELSTFSYDQIWAHPTGVFVTTINGKKGMLNPDGLETVYAKYDDVLPQMDGNVVVRIGEKYGLLTQKGVSIYPITYDGISLNAYSGEYLLLTRVKPFEFK